MIAPPEQPPELIGLRLIGEVKSLSLGPEDVVVIRFSEPLTKQEVEDVIGQWQQITGLPNRVFVLGGGADVKKVTPR